MRIRKMQTQTITKSKDLFTLGCTYFLREKKELDMMFDFHICLEYQNRQKTTRAPAFIIFY
jgi:hypothetical protein